MSTTVYLATYDAGGYDVTAVGATREEVLEVLERAVKAYWRQYSTAEQVTEDWAAVDLDEIHVAEMTTGHAYLDEGRAGEQRLT